MHFMTRQPIITERGKIFAYDLLMSDGEQINDRHLATASTVETLLNRFGLHAVAGNSPVFIRTDATFLHHDLVFSLPINAFIIAIEPSITCDYTNCSRIEALVAAGYTLGINDIALDSDTLEKFALVLEHLSYIKIDLHHSNKTLLRSILSNPLFQHIRFIVTNVNEHSEFDFAQALGFELFQGDFFSRPTTLKHESFQPEHLAVIQLYEMLSNEAPIEEVVNEFTLHHTLVIELLQYINSAMFSFNQQIASIKQVITLLGRKPLAQWLLLILYSKAFSDVAFETPLILRVKSRVNLMQGLLKLHSPAEYDHLREAAFLVGVFSLLDVVFHRPIDEILKNFNADSLITDAILHKRNTLGVIFALILNLEQCDALALESFAQHSALDSDALQQLLNENLQELNTLEQVICCSA